MTRAIAMLALAAFIFGGARMPAGAAGPAQTNTWDDAHAALKRLDYQKAEEGFRNFLIGSVNDPRRTLCQYYIGYCALKRGRDQQAITVWNELLRQEKLAKAPTLASLSALEQMALYYDSRKRAQDVALALTALWQGFPTNQVTVRLFSAEAQKLIASGRFAEAAALYGKVESCLSEEDRKNLDMARALGDPARKSSDGILGYANQCLESDHVDQAIHVYEAFLKQPGIGSDAWEAKTRLGWCLYLKTEYDKAESLWKNVVQNAPKKSKWTGMSRWNLIVLNAGPYNKIDQAIELCEAQAREYPGEFYEEQALFTKAWLCWAHKKWPEAKKGFDALLKAYPEKADHPPIRQYIQDCEKGLSGGKG